MINAGSSDAMIEQTAAGPRGLRDEQRSTVAELVESYCQRFGGTPAQLAEAAGIEAGRFASYLDGRAVDDCPCDLPSQKQFEDITDYVTVTRDKWGNETPQDWTNHSDSTPGMGMPGDRQFSSNKADLQSTGYGNQDGINEIPYGQGAGFNRATTVYVAVDRADRGNSE